jgi:hypothetical protein
VILPPQEDRVTSPEQILRLKAQERLVVDLLAKLPCLRVDQATQWSVGQANITETQLEQLRNPFGMTTFCDRQP